MATKKLTCKFGSNCKFSHEKPKVCKFFGTAKGCKFGLNCKFEHPCQNDAEKSNDQSDVEEGTDEEKSYADSEEHEWLISSWVMSQGPMCPY